MYSRTDGCSYSPGILDKTSFGGTVMEIEFRKIGCQFIYRVKGATIWHSNKEEAKTFFIAYKE
jgi:hypothetical protein